jgi:iron complex outermembrane receptor protein
VLNWRQDVDLSVNTNLFPDLYSYNFDAVNILTLPLERRSFLTALEYEFDNGIEVFGQFGWTEYNSATALAPTPFPTIRTKAPGENASNEATSPYVTPGSTISNVLVVPRTNPFFAASADLAALLDSRTGDDARLVGTGADEPILIRSRSLPAGLRQANYDNTVIQYLVGARGPLFSDNWSWEIYASEGTTEIQRKQTGNLDTQRIYNLINAPDGGVSICEGGLNLVGVNDWSDECVDYISVDAITQQDFKLNVVQGFVSGDVVDLPAGSLSMVFGAEGRWFEYNFDPGVLSGPISGFNTQLAVKAKNKFEDLFLEALIPIVENVEASVGYRYSTASFQQEGESAPSKSSDAYKLELSWQALDFVRLRASYQRAVRAPNFNELFDGGGSAPQYFDPCSVTGVQRTGPDAAAMRALCEATGVAAPDTFVQSPGGQLSISTAGNTDLDPEEADTITLGVVFQSPWGGALEGLQASLDYYSIDIKGPILTPDVNVITADCYNYYGNNPSYDASYSSCAGLVRFGGDILFISGPNPDGTYPGVNGGKLGTEGIDLQVSYATDLPVGQLGLNFMLNYLLSADRQELDSLPTIDYSGSVAYFGSGLGTSFPEFKWNLTGVYTIGDFAFDARVRWIDSMKNRASLQFPGETQPTGVGSVTYLDLGVTYTMDRFLPNSSLRLGLNNATDEQPPEYAPNVQSGTDPSLYDVIGRRFFASVNFRF